ncbi:MAG: hypothetical protein ACR2NU_11695 [Aeoliella sp.]
MTTAAPSTRPKPNKAQQAQNAFAKLLADVSRRGFHGTAGIALVMQDGHIQHLRVSVEEMVK